MKAKRGDIAVIVSETRDFYIDRTSVVRTRAEIAEVTSVTREGVVKAVRTVWPDARPVPVAHLPRQHTLYIVPRAEVDVPAALKSAREHCWPGHPNQPMPYDGVDEVRDMLRPHRLTSGKAS